MAVEKTLFDLSFKNEEKYINSVSIAKLLQSMLNEANGSPDFYVSFDSNKDNAPKAKYMGTLAMDIEPFSLRGTLAETISLELKINMESELESDKIAVAKTIDKVLGPVEGTFTVCETIDGEDVAVNYEFWCNLSKARTTTSGDIGNGGAYYSVCTLKGYMHVIREGGGLLSNMVKTFISIGDTLHEVIFKTGNAGVVFNTSNPLKGGSFLADTEYISGAYAKSAIILYRDDYICRLLRDICERKVADKDNPFLNTTTGEFFIRIVEAYPDKELSADYYLLQSTVNRESGAYVSIQLALTQKEV